MLFEIVHVNGIYDPDRRQHRYPSDRTAYFGRLATATADALAHGAEVLYAPNYGTHFYQHQPISSPAVIGAALKTDPFLEILGDTAQHITVAPDGMGVSAEFQAQRRQAEDEAAKRLGRVLVCGAYFGECVPFIASNVLARNPDAQVAIDSGLSINRGVNISTIPAMLDMPLGIMLSKLKT